MARPSAAALAGCRGLLPPPAPWPGRPLPLWPAAAAWPLTAVAALPARPSAAACQRRRPQALGSTAAWATAAAGARLDGGICRRPAREQRGRPSTAAGAGATVRAEVLIPRPAATALTFGEGYTQLFGDSNLRLHGDGKRVHISLDQRTGSGFASQGAHLHGFFSASIKLPADYAAGVVVAFYMSNGDVYEKTHDELDFEFLGNVRGREWRVQTNVYGDGSTAVGREERYGLWFDPTRDFHRYAILWTNRTIV